MWFLLGWLRMRHTTVENVSVELLRATICRDEGAVCAAEHRMEERECS